VFVIAMFVGGVDLEVGSCLLVQKNEVHTLLCAKGNDNEHNDTTNDDGRNDTTRDSQSLAESARFATAIVALVALATQAEGRVRWGYFDRTVNGIVLYQIGIVDTGKNTVDLLRLDVGGSHC